MWNLPFIFGLVAGIFGLSFLLYQIITKAVYTEQTEGTVGLAHENRMGMDISYTCLTYTANGVVYTRPLSGSNKLAPGDVVTVQCNPSKPEKYYILQDKSNLRIIAVAFIIGGIVLMLIGFAMYRGLFGGI